MKSKPSKLNCVDILGGHPLDGLGAIVVASDSQTDAGVPHRALRELDGKREDVVRCMREMVARHHASPEQRARDKQRRDAMKRLGFDAEQGSMKRFPENPSTRKGNLAEIILAEYVSLAADLELLVYRLRYNPNVNQSMKGNDVLAFDLDSDPVRIVVGETKFRATSSKAAVTEIIDGLVRSHKGGIPVSMQFVVDRLFEAGQEELGQRVLECAVLFALDNLRVDYVGLLMSDPEGPERVKKHASGPIHRLAMVSFGINSPDSIVDPCYEGLEE